MSKFYRALEETSVPCSCCWQSKSRSNIPSLYAWSSAMVDRSKQQLTWKATDQAKSKALREVGLQFPGVGIPYSIGEKLPHCVPTHWRKVSLHANCQDFTAPSPTLAIIDLSWANSASMKCRCDAFVGNCCGAIRLTSCPTIILPAIKVPSQPSLPSCFRCYSPWS